MADTSCSTSMGPIHDYRANPFGLVYEYPITENKPGEVNIHPVTYTLRELKISANVYTPAEYNPTRSYPAITVAHPNGGTKEQVAGRYAQRLAELGYITIAADAAYQGHSEGTPRNVAKPHFRTDDIHGMADFLESFPGFPGVDTNRIAALGICGGGGYTLNAAKTDKCFKSVATVSMFNSGLVRRNGLQNSQIHTIQDRLQQASQARTDETLGETTITYAGDADLTDEQVDKYVDAAIEKLGEFYARTL